MCLPSYISNYLDHIIVSPQGQGAHGAPALRGCQWICSPPRRPHSCSRVYLEGGKEVVEEGFTLGGFYTGETGEGKAV